MEVRDLMTTGLATVKKTNTVAQARQLLREYRVSALPVEGDKQEPLGIVSAVDLAADLDGDTPIGDVMTGGIFAIGPSDDVTKAAQVMLNQRIHHLVVAEESTVVGFLSAFDLLRVISP